MTTQMLQPAAPPPVDRLTRFADLIGRLIPDAMTTSIGLLAIVAVAALAMGTTVGDTMSAYHRGLWMLLPFTMQMTLILVLSSSLGASPIFKRVICALSERPGSVSGVLGAAILLTAALSYVYWGLGITLGPLIAVHFAREAEKKGLAVDFPFLLATTGAAMSVWQFGLSASAPLLMNTPGHFLEKTTGLMPLRTTIFAPAALLFVAAFLVTLVVTARLLLPRHARPLSHFPEAWKLGERAAPAGGADAAALTVPATFSERLESHPLPTALLSAVLAGWLVYHFAVANGGLELNSLNTALLLLCLLCHRSVRNFSRTLPFAAVSAWPVVVLYHLYAGVAGVIQFTTVGSTLGEFFASISNQFTFPLLTAASASLVSIFVPSSGGQWVIQGFITATTAAAVGVTAQRGLLALSIGDHMGNLLSPFWVVIAAGIARIDFRQFIGYNVVYAALWFALGVLCFTFLPA
ncbi:MAG TPA: TIGR00366 family protein [Vicinamibacterales bacterium]|nr:TIGR00366 family protein [Vicinamibacterales bacterium]